MRIKEIARTIHLYQPIRDTSRFAHLLCCYACSVLIENPYETWPTSWSCWKLDMDRGCLHGDYAWRRFASDGVLNSQYDLAHGTGCTRSACVAAYSSDLRIASHAARFGMPEITLGWPPGYGVAQLTALVGKSRALELCLMGEPITSSQALDWGLVSEVVSGASLRKRGMQIAERMLQMPSVALRETKRLVHLDEGIQSKVSHRADTDAYIRCLELPDAQEGLAAFAEKRKPKFDGR
jgi:hypothetical protein